MPTWAVESKSTLLMNTCFNVVYKSDYYPFSMSCIPGALKRETESGAKPHGRLGKHFREHKTLVLEGYLVVFHGPFSS